LRHNVGQDWAYLKAYNLDRIRMPALADTQRTFMELFGLPAIPQSDLARISVPTTLIWGRHDLATPLSVAQDVSRRHEWPLHVINNAADDPAIEQPESFVAVLRAVLDA
jgi:pimeloyl-ACP methyl ester carboxylesterase